MKLFYLLSLMIIGVSGYAILKNAHTRHLPAVTETKKLKNNTRTEALRLKTYTEDMRSYLKKNGYYENLCFLIDMKIPSGKKRFFVYDLKGDSVMLTGMVTHGSGSQTATDSLIFSNISGSNATSLGKYKIGNEYTGKFGLAFKLTGLDRTNRNAYERAVVLYAHPLVPATETWPQLICTSWGCPTVNPDFLLQLKKIIHAADKPMILKIFY